MLSLERAKPEKNESLPPLHGRRVLITGASRGLGKSVMNLALSNGSEIIAGARCLESFKEEIVLFGRSDVYPLFADLSKPLEVQYKSDLLIKENIEPTDLVFIAGSGFESILQRFFLPSFFRGLHKSRHNAEELSAYLSEKKGALRTLVEQDYERALQINSYSTLQLIKTFLPSLRQTQGRIIFVSSLWSDLIGQIEVPEFYKSVAATKHDLLEKLAFVTPDLRKMGINVMVVSAHLLPDTTTGDQLKEFSKKFPEIIQFNNDFPFPTTSEVALEIVNLLKDDPYKWVYPRQGLPGRYIVRSGRVLTAIDAKSAELDGFGMKI